MRPGCCFILVFILALAPLFGGQSVADELTASVSFSRSEITFDKLNGYDMVLIADCDITREVGEPQLPVKIVHVALPPGAEIDRVELLAAEGEEIEETFLLYPVQPSQILGKPDEKELDIDFTEPKETVYRSSNPYPVHLVEPTHAGSMGGYRVAGLLVYPIQYIPSEGKLLFHSRIEFRVHYSATRSENRLLKGRQSRFNEVQRRSAERIVLNPERISHRSGLRGDVLSLVPPGEYEYVIITDEVYVSAFQPLADWKTKKGLPATIVTTTWIYENYSGIDDQEQIRNFIRDAYENWGTVWLLIGGDTDIVPERTAWAMDCEYGGEPDENDIPADLYYADLDGTWDDNGNGLYGEVEDNVDLYPDVFIGRASVNTIREVEAFVHKILTYEKPLDADQLMKMLFLGEIMWQSPYTDGGEGKNMIDDECIPPRFDPITKLYQSQGNESRESVIDAMNDGYHIINHDGHCWWTVMGVGNGSLVRLDMDGLRNDPAYGIIYSIGCWPAAIDYDCIAEHFVNNPHGGGVAYIGNSRYGWGSPGNPGYGYSDRFDHRFYIELFHNGISNIGATLAATKAHYVGRSRQENVYRIHQYEVNLLGDPEMDIWTNRPLELTVDHPLEVSTDQNPFTLTGFTVTVTSENVPVPGAQVCLMNGADLYHRDRTNTQGQVLFHFNVDVADTIWVTVAAHNYLPYEGLATVMVEGPHVGCDTYFFQDSTGGNDDDLVNPGETIGLWISVENSGDEVAKKVTGILRANDPLVTVIDSIWNFGNVLPGVKELILSYREDRYTFEISPQTENSHTIHFTLEISDSSGHVWRNIIPITVAAPVLVLEEYHVDDSTSGNGNGVIDDGEIIFLEIDIRNAGLGIAYDVEVNPQGGNCNIDILDSLLSLGDISPGSTATSSFSIEVIPSLCPAYYMDIYTLTITTSDDFYFSDGFSLQRDQAEWGFADDMEKGDTLWTHEGEGDLWHLTQHRSHSGQFSWYCGHDGRWRYDKDMDCSLISEPITLGPRARLSFWHWYEVAVYGVNGILVDIDDGTGWRKLDFIGSGGALLPIGNEWIEDTYDLSPYPAGTQVRVRFRFVSDRERTFEGMYIDDVQVYSNFSAPLPMLDLMAFSFDDDTIGFSYGNGNGFVDPGETIELQVELRNYGDAMAPEVTANISTIDPYVSVLNGSCDIGDVGPGVEVSAGNTFLISVSKDAPNRQVIYLNLCIEDAKGNLWDESMALTVSQPEFVFSSFTAPDVIGNSDGNPDAGETCYLNLTLENPGLRPATGITTTLTTTCADVMIIDGTSTFTDIPVDSVGDNRLSPFLFNINGYTTDHVISFQVHLNEGGGFCQADLSLNVLMNQERVLLVADDGTYRNSGYYTDVLNEFGIPYLLWSVIDDGEVPGDTILSFDEVIWFTGAEAGNTLTEQDRDALSLFLDNGGRLILSGNMIGVYTGMSEFYSQYLHAKYVSFMTDLHNLKGVEGNPVSDGMYIQLADQGLNAQGFCGEIDPLAPAFGIFEYDRTTDEGPGRIQSSGMGAIAVETDDFKVAYFSFGLEGIEPFESRYDVFEALFNWFRGRPIDVRAKLGFVDWSINDDEEGASSGDGDGFPNPGEEIELSISLANDGFLTGEDIVGTLRTDDEFVIITDSTANFGDIGPDSTVESLDAFVFSISTEAPQAHEVIFDLSLTDARGNLSHEDFDLTVYLTSTISGCITDVGTSVGIAGATLHWLGSFNEVTGAYDQIGFATADDEGNYVVSLINDQYWIRGEAQDFLPSDWEEIQFPPDTSGVDFALESPRIECDPESFSVQLNPGETRESTLEISNTYTGELHYAIIEAEPSLLIPVIQDPYNFSIVDTFDLKLDSLPKAPRSLVASEAIFLPDPERWQLIYIDADEPDNALDFDKLYAQNDDQDLYFKIQAREPWSNPRNDFYVHIVIDADNNVQTGLPVWGEIGADYVLVTGAVSILVRWDSRTESFVDHALLSFVNLPSSCDSLEVGIHLADIDMPKVIKLYFEFVNLHQERLDDQAPDGGLGYIPYSTYNAEWLSMYPTFGLVHEGQSNVIVLNFDAADVLPGEYNMNVVIENNQPQRGSVVIPVRLTVGETGIDGSDVFTVPTEYALGQNYPNPFNPTTTIHYALPGGDRRQKTGDRTILIQTTLKIYNVLGQEVRTLIDEYKQPGFYSITWNGKDERGAIVPSGVYFYQLTSGDFSQTKKMLLMK